LVSHNPETQNLDLVYTMDFSMNYEFDAPNTLYAHLNTIEFPLDIQEYKQLYTTLKNSSCDVLGMDDNKEYESVSLVVGF
jgi:hypothetical protein